MSWPICTFKGCSHGRHHDRIEEAPANWVFTEPKTGRGGQAICWCHRDVYELPSGFEHFPCDQNPQPPPTPAEMAEIYKSLGVQEP